MSSRKVRKVVTGQATTDGAGVELVRVIGQPELMDLDPFLLLDAFRSDNPDDYIAGFPPHPHRGFEALTYLLNGKMRHQDNAGNEGVIEAGGIQWMTAGKGIVHSEMPEQQNGLLEGFQLWINLPGMYKMTTPAYQEHDATQIPTELRPGTEIRVISGETSQGTVGPVSQPLTDPLYLDVSLQAGVEFNENFAADHNAFVYVINGTVMLEDVDGVKLNLECDQLAVLGRGDSLTLRTGDQTSRMLLVAGKPLNEPVARGGPFVMNTDEEVRQAFSDYQRGNF
ncbi:MAG: pirin family protein [Gammaproteobacteria bacterium]|nr:pirin family protein [Gammaproteobacteria bacterium]